MKINKTITIIVALVGLLVGGLSAGVFLSQRSLTGGVAPSAQEGKPSVEDDNGDDNDRADVTPVQAGITAEEARAAAEAGNPGSKALEVELENENGTLVYEVELDNGLEIIVDAANGDILGAEPDEVD